MVNSGIFEAAAGQKPFWHSWLKFASAVASIGGFFVTIAVVPGLRWGLWVNDELLEQRIHLEQVKAEQIHSVLMDSAVRTMLDVIKAQIEQKHLDLVQRLTRVEVAIERK